MIRVYLDWNAYSRIMNSNEQFYPQLRKILLGKDNKYIFPYSTAHLIDIYTSYEKVGWKNIQGHLQKLNLSNSLVIKNVFGEDLSFYSNNPVEEMKLYISERNKNEKFGEINKEPKKNKIDYFPETTKFLEENEKRFELLDKLNEKLIKINEAFLGENFKEDYQKSLKISKGKLLDKKTNPIEYLNQNIKQINFSNLESYNSKILSIINKKTDLYDELTSLFLTIDISGYAEDNVDIDSTITDSLHCAYASLCDIFIVDDKKTYLKSKEVYKIKELNIKTFRPKEFLEFYNQNYFEIDYNNFINFIYDFPKNNQYVKKSKFGFSFNLDYYLFDYFNYILFDNLDRDKIQLIQLIKTTTETNLGLLEIEKKDIYKKVKNVFGEPNIVKDEWSKNGFFSSAWIKKYENSEFVDLIRLDIRADFVKLSINKLKKKK